MSDEPVAFREEMRQGFSEIRQEFAAVREEIRRDFAAVREDMRQEFAAVRGEMSEGFAEIRQQIGELRQQLAALSSRVDILEERVRVLEDRVRANGVLLEALRDDVRQIAETRVGLSRRVEEYRGESDAQRTILSLLQTSYRDLDRRVTRLEERAGEMGPRSRPS